MTDANCLPTHAHLGLVLHRILVDIRNWSLLYQKHPEAAEEITGLTPALVGELTDLAEIIPLQFINTDEQWLAVIAASLRDLAAKYPFARRYAAALEMSPDEVFRGLVPNHTLRTTGRLANPPACHTNRTARPN